MSSRIDNINIDAHEGRLDDMEWRVALGEEGRRLEATIDALVEALEKTNVCQKCEGDCNRCGVERLITKALKLAKEQA